LNPSYFEFSTSNLSWSRPLWLLDNSTFSGWGLPCPSGSEMIAFSLGVGGLE